MAIHANSTAAPGSRRADAPGPISSRITVETRQVYGMTRVYPVCAMAKRLAAVAGTKTLTDHALDEIRKLGFDIVDRTSIGAQLARMLTTAA